jgi:membrane protein
VDLGLWKRRVERPIEQVRERSSLVDHVLTMLAHYGRVDGSGRAGAVTYYAFLAFFPIMALAFFAVGLIANVYEDARENLTDIINQLFDGLIGTGDGQISIDVFADNATPAGILGLLVFLYAGLGWMSAMRKALQSLFDAAESERLGFVMGKVRDLMALGLVGAMLLVALAVTSAVNHFSEDIIEWVGLDPESELATLGLQLVGALLGVVVITALLLVLYQFLARPRVSQRALREGAVLAAIGFVVLKLIADWLIAMTHGNPAFTVFGVALVLLVLINYFTRVVMYGAAWAYTSEREPDLNAESS